MTKRPHVTQAAAAAIAGFSERTERKIDHDPTPPSQRRSPRTWRTREDPLAEAWPRAEELLRIDKGMMAVTVFETLQEEYGSDAVPPMAFAVRPVDSRGAVFPWRSVRLQNG